MAEFRYSAQGRKGMLLYMARSLVFGLVILFPVLSFGQIGPDIACNSCHTMHNSQDGVNMTSPGTAAIEALLQSSCIGCHQGDSTLNPDPTTGTGFPLVFDPAGPDYGTHGSDGDTLAGGNFYWVREGVPPSDHRKGHNVAGVSDVDDLYSVGGGRPNIPGFGSQLTAQMTCAGMPGIVACHGNVTAGNELASLRSGTKGAHHEADSVIDGLSVPTSYRFLSGITGIEDGDWEFTVSGGPPDSPKDHNQYKGGGTADTISSFCERCHGDFHLSGGSPFVRHPVDVSLPTDAATEYAAYVTYKPQTPVASSDLALGVTDNVFVDTKRIVMCISCHRAHGTKYDALLRWNYKAWPGGVDPYNGCGDCHSIKN